MKVSVVIAAYDERENAEILARRLDAALRELAPARREILFVVEGTDGTRELLEGLAGEILGLRVLYESEPRGLGRAFRRGFAAVADDSDVVVTMDADLNHRPEELPRLVAELERSSADIIVGSRMVAGSRADRIPVWKRITSLVMNWILGLLFGVRILDKTSGFRVYRAAALRRLLGYRDQSFGFLPEMLILASQQGMRVVEAPIHFEYRIHGVSKMPIWSTCLSYLRLLASRLRRRGRSGVVDMPRDPAVERVPGPRSAG